MNAAFVSATTVVLVWQLPTIGESAGVDSFILSYSLRGDSENTTHTRQQPGGYGHPGLPERSGAGGDYHRSGQPGHRAGDG